MSPALAGLALLVAGLAPLPADTILLVGDRTFGGSTRVAETLDALAAATGIVGDTRFEVLADVGASDERLPATLADRDDLRAALVVLGDLTFLPGVDPTRDVPPDQHALTDRTVDPRALDDALARVEALRATSSCPVVLVTAPLGEQARVEVPELLPIAERVRSLPPVLDLAATFHAREDSPMFGNHLDVLDGFGHEAFARAVFVELCRQDGPLAPRDASERAARLARRALEAWAADDAGWAVLAEEAVSLDASTHAARAQQAALVGLLEGKVAARAAWTRVGGDVPGRMLAAVTLHVDSPVPPAEDPAEALLAEAVALALTGRRDAARDLLSDARARFPHRFDTWLVATRASASREEADRLVAEALSALRRLDPAPVVQRRAREALLASVFPVPQLLAACVLQAPFEGCVPTGPALDRARRAARLDLVEIARTRWERDRAGAPVPPAWDAEVRRLLESLDG